jgi:hypothetical protein
MPDPRPNCPAATSVAGCAVGQWTPGRAGARPCRLDRRPGRLPRAPLGPADGGRRQARWTRGRASPDLGCSLAHDPAPGRPSRRSASGRGLCHLSHRQCGQPGNVRTPGRSSPGDLEGRRGGALRFRALHAHNRRLRAGAAQALDACADHLVGRNDLSLAVDQNAGRHHHDPGQRQQ